MQCNVCGMQVGAYEVRRCLDGGLSKLATRGWGDARHVAFEHSLLFFFFVIPCICREMAPGSRQF